MSKIPSTKILTKKQSDKLHKEFNITSVCRADITKYISKEKALKITDDQMIEIADKMADSYCDIGFWESLEVLCDQYK